MTSPTSPAVPDEVARAALDIATNARIQPWTRRADLQGVRDAIAYAYAAAAMPDGTVITREWMTTWTWPDGHVEEVPAAASDLTRETAEQVARRRAARPMTGSVGAVLCREVRTGPWVPVAVDDAGVTP